MTKRNKWLITGSVVVLILTISIAAVFTTQNGLNDKEKVAKSTPVWGISTIINPAVRPVFLRSQPSNGWRR